MLLSTFSVIDNVIDDLLLIIIILFRDQNIFCTVGNTAPQCNVSCITSHNLNDAAALMGCGCIAHAVDCIHGRIHCGVKADGVFCTCNIKVNGSRYTNCIYAKSCQLLCACKGTVSTDDYQTINSMFLADLRTFSLTIFCTKL